jgi:Pyruvate/2-oxoacid:ferredoxin oxidoreductase delta subunit
MASAIKRNADAGKGVFAMKAFGGGNLTGDYLTALDYVSGLPGVASIMIGFGYHHEIDRIIEYAEGTIDRNYIPDIKNKKIQIDPGDCEGCGTCIERCPNRAIYKAESGVGDVDHSICLTCGYCAPVCPVRAIIMY